MSLHKVRAQNEFLFSPLLEKLFHWYSRMDFSFLRFKCRLPIHMTSTWRPILDSSNADLKPRFFCDGANGRVLALTRRFMNFFFCPSVIAKLKVDL